ncbi:MAG: hypothetical protein H7308_18400 [Chthonomonadaceae bacterium]|nr:hypothetical protein [Chthonomonadaceae bacterium]
MKSRTTADFRRRFTELPSTVQRQAKMAYGRFQENPQHPGLRFRQIHASEPIYSARVGIHYRAVGVVDGDEVV